MKLRLFDYIYIAFIVAALMVVPIVAPPMQLDLPDSLDIIWELSLISVFGMKISLLTIMGYLLAMMTTVLVIAMRLKES